MHTIIHPPLPPTHTLHLACVPQVPSGRFVLEHLLSVVKENEAEKQVEHSKQTHPDNCREEQQEEGDPEGVLEY